MVRKEMPTWRILVIYKIIRRHEDIQVEGNVTYVMFMVLMIN